MKNLLVAFFVFLTTASWATDASILGVWATQKQNKNARIKIETCAHNDKKICGKIIWLQESSYEDGTLKQDKNNPDHHLQSRGLLNLELLADFIYNPDDSTWTNGTLYNPEDGNIYACTMTLNKGEDDKPDTLEVRGYVGISLFGQTQTWVRVE